MKLKELFPSECFIISAKCVECGKEAEVIYPHREGGRKVMLRCVDCGEDYLKIRYDERGKISSHKFGSCQMIGLLDSVIPIGK